MARPDARDRSNLDEVTWTQEMAPGELNRLPELQRRGKKLREIVADRLVMEAEELLSEYEELEIDDLRYLAVVGFLDAAQILRNVFEFNLRGGSIRLAETIEEILPENKKVSPLEDKVEFLGEKLRRDLGTLVPDEDGWQKFNDVSTLLFILGQLSRLEPQLEADHKGFQLADFLTGEQAPLVNPTPGMEHGRSKFAQRYRQLYDILLQKGATADS